MSVYSNLTQKRKTKKDAEARRKAEYLASLPKHPVKRLLYRLHPKRVWGYWFSKKGGIMALKIVGVGILLAVLGVGALFAYYRKDLDAIRPGELDKRVATTVTKYVDRNGITLWEDKGDGDYKIVVDGKDITDYMKKATIAIEDRDFYKHGGVSVTGIFRSLINNANGGSIQGGSTLTQQLVKQVFFPPDEAAQRGISGIPRKIKEAILAIEVERMYDKDAILNLYLNESSYGGRRNGVESGAQTYFGKSAKELSLPEAALLAGIPNQPGLYDPYNVDGHEALIARQHKVLDNMADQGYITKAQAEEAKKYPILDNIKPASDQFKDIKAPHFVQMVKSQLEQELGKATVGRGGLIVKTTLDIRIQNKLEESMNKKFASSEPDFAGYTNGAATVEDTQSGQIVAMMGSRDYNYPGFGQDNAATAFIQPGSTIKPLVYAQLFSNQGPGKANYGSGSILSDVKTTFPDSGNYTPNNADHGFKGNIDVRLSLGLSRNIPAIKAMYVSGIKPTWDLIHALGDTQYCTQGVDAQAGLSSAIGGCGTRQIDHVNAFASLARGGVYKPISTILEVKNSQGEVIKKFKDESKQVLDPQAAYIVSDILSDDNARSGLYGHNKYGLSVPGVKTAAKTGTSDKDGQAKDIWTMSYSPALTMGVWLGNPDTRILKNGNSSLPASVVGDVMEYAHKEIYAAEGKWKSGDWIPQPAGIQKIGNELFPSYYNKNQGQTNAKLTFDKVSKKKATDCTPDGARIEVNVTKIQDPITKKDVYLAPDGYDATKNDDFHKCDDSKPTVGTITVSGNNISVSVAQGTNKLREIQVTVDGTVVATLPAAASGTYSTTHNFSDGSHTISATVTDEGYYTGTNSVTKSYP